MNPKNIRADISSENDYALTDAIDQIYEKIDACFLSHKFSKVDELLSEVDVRKSPTSILLGYLAATLPAKGRLKQRQNFYEKVQEELRRREEPEGELLSGLL